MKKTIVFIGLILLIFTLTSCKSDKSIKNDKLTESVKKITTAVNEEMDPLKTARLKLFNEIGIKENNTNNKKNNNLPPVTLSPPTLPKTDVNIY